MEVGLPHQSGVIWPGECEFEVISGFGAMRGLCGIAMEVMNGGFLDLWFNKESRPETGVFKVQGMGHGRLRPERRSLRFEMDIAHGS